MNAPIDTSGKSVPAVRRAAVILSLLARQQPLNLSQIAKEAGILPSTALYILRELAAARLVSIDAHQKMYRLGPGIVELAQSASRPRDFADIAKPVLKAIALRFDVTATATAVLDDDHSACVASVSPPHAMSLSVTVGGRVPTLSGAAGRCIAAFNDSSRSELRKRFGKIRWQLPLDFETWLKQVEHAREVGWAEDDGLFARGVVTMAAPVFDADGTVAKVIGIASIAAAFEASCRPALAKALTEAAERVSGEMASIGG